MKIESGGVSFDMTIDKFHKFINDKKLKLALETTELPPPTFSNRGVLS